MAKYDNSTHFKELQKICRSDKKKYEPFYGKRKQELFEHMVKRDAKVECDNTVVVECDNTVVEGDATVESETTAQDGPPLPKEAKYIDLFCGIGSFHYSFQKLGFKCVMASDIYKPSVDNYKENYNMDHAGAASIWIKDYLSQSKLKDKTIVLNKEDEEISATKGDLVMTFEDQSPVDTILGIEIFSVIHIASNEKIFVSLEDIKDE